MTVILRTLKLGQADLGKRNLRQKDQNPDRTMSHGWKNITSLLWGKFGNIRTSVMPILDLSRLHCKLYKIFLWLMGSVTPEKLLTALSLNMKRLLCICLYENPMQLLLELNLWRPIQFSSVAQSCPTLCNPMNCSTPGLPVHHQLPEFTQTHVHRVSDAIQPSHPLSSPSPPPPIPSNIRVFSNESTLCMRWPKYWSFSFNISFQRTPRTDL